MSLTTCTDQELERPRTAIKAQALVDFVAEFTAKGDEDEIPMPWIIWMDGSSNQRVGGVRVILQSLEGDLIESAIHLQVLTTNNEAEYKVVLTSLDLAKVAVASLVVIHSNSLHVSL